MDLRKAAVSLCVILIFMLVAESCFSAPCYGPAMPKKQGSWILGYESDFIFKRDLVEDYGKMRLFQHFFTMSLGIFSWLSIDGKLGIGDVRSTGGIYPTVKYDYGFSGAYGFRVRLLKQDTHKVNLVAGFQHISVHPPGKNVDSDKNQVIVDDWQGSVLVSKRMGNFDPYLGVKISECDLIHKLNETGRKRRKSYLSGGVFLGADYYIRDNVKVNLEGRFIDETAFNCGVAYIF